MNTPAFSEENRMTYLAESISSIDAILNDALLGDDQNEIRPNFPPNCTRDAVIVENTRVGLVFLNDSEVAVIEISIQLSFEENTIGEYRSIYNLNGELEDEFFSIE